MTVMIALVVLRLVSLGDWASQMVLGFGVVADLVVLVPASVGSGLLYWFLRLP